MNECFAQNRVPGPWLVARVAMIFEKGDPALSENYRPVCLTSVAYRIYASLLKQRLLDAGLDDRLWKSQYGFRRGRSTEDAIYIARRHIELACARRQGKVSLLALDWRRAFDSISVPSLLDSLRRFGLPEKITQVVASLMLERRFFVEDCGATSEPRSQKSGISQGCTLSPLLFIIMMSALMHDAVSLLSPSAAQAYSQGNLADLAYADDTLLIGASSEHVQEFLSAVAQAGQRYGLELHPDKLQLLQIHGRGKIITDSGTEVTAVSSLVYLGATLAADGRMGSELSRRIGAAKADFRTLQKVWGHSDLTLSRKLEIYAALVESKLFYGLTAGCFSVAELRRLDGFQARCLRSILKIPPSFISRVPNSIVRERAQSETASQKLLKRQLVLLGKVMRASLDGTLQQVSFIPGTTQPATARYVRRVGRPRKEWIPQLMPEAYRIAGGMQQLEVAVMDSVRWKSLVRSAF